MRKIAIFIIVLLAINYTDVLAQSCLPNGIIFSSQEQIDNFQTNNPNCTEIEGDVIINGVDITNLNGLIVLTSIGGDLSIGGLFNPSGLNTLIGLDNIETIGGNLFIRFNDSLNVLTGLNNLSFIGGNFHISMSSILNFNGMNNLDSIDGDFEIYTNGALINFIGLEDLKTIGGNLSIKGNNAILSLSGLDNLMSIDGNLTIGGPNPTIIGGGGSMYLPNDALLNLAGLGSLNFIGGDLSIIGNDTLSSLNELLNLTSIGGQLIIAGLPELTSLGGLDNIIPESITDLTISNNPSLGNCSIQNICDYLINPNGSVNIFKNGIGCSNPSEVASGCGITISCLPYGNYYFFTQEEIDDFQTEYPGCNELQGLVAINGDDIINLYGLNNVISIGGSLEVSQTSYLTNLAGLKNLTSIVGNLIISHFSYYGNPMLTSLNGLDNLATIGSDLILEGHTSLVSIANLGNVSSIGGELRIKRNSSLVSLEGLDNVTTIGGDLEIKSNASLLSLSGIDNIDASTIGYINIFDNTSLSICEVESVCEYIANQYGSVNINENAAGCNSQEEVEEACEIVGVDQLQVAGYGLQVFPNPFTTTTTIEYELTKPGTANITIFNHFGQQVESIEQGNLQSGKQQYVWNASEMPAGIYFVQVRAGTEVGMRKVVKMR